MGELTVSTFLTLDGVMQAPGGPTEDPSGGFRHGGWLVPLFDDAGGDIVDEVFEKADAFLLGRKTYDIFSAYWPRVPDTSDPIAAKLNRLPKFVASRTRTRFDWKGTTHIRDVVKDVPELKKRFEREVQVHGSSELAQTLIANDLVDEYRLMIFPAVIGSGKRLFGPGVKPSSLTLVRSDFTSTGVIVCFYRRAGNLKTGSFDLLESGEQITSRYS